MSRADSPLRDRMVFVVGSHRSGTNWIQRILAAHPTVASVRSETFLFSKGVAGLRERVQHASVGSWQLGSVYMERDAFLDAVRDLCDAIFGGLLETTGSDAARLVERTPEHVHHLDLMRNVYPDGWFIHIIRDGRDVARSIASMEWGPGSPVDAAAMWRDAVTAGRTAAKDIQRYREVRYEDLLADPAAVVVDLYAWLGLDAGSDAVDLAVTESGVPYNVDPSRPAIGTGKWREGLSTSEIDGVLDVAGELLADLGYAAAPDAHEGPRAAAGGAGAATPARAARSRRQRARALMARVRPRAAEPRGAIQTLRFAAPVVDQLLDAIVEGRRDAASALLTADAALRVVSASEDWTGRGPDAQARLLDTLFADPVLCGRQVRSDVHPSIPAFTVVAAYETPDGRVAERVFVVRVRDGAVNGITYYALPLG